MELLTERLAHLYKLRPELEGERGQTGLVKASGASKSVVNQWLSGGIKKMAIEYALEIERSLGFCHIWLMTGKGPVEVKDLPAGLSSNEEVLLAAYRAANDTERDLFDSITRAVRRRLGAEPSRQNV